ncbi:hypothetical protein V5799_003337 [Amblyomma americanum]|uniref:BPTI/Kunitz inhibitor domain-containing protein n=1 Tax=Amblyomma americanum TaxID=6943 RepID=A0AAQ4D992_AMBAM
MHCLLICLLGLTLVTASRSEQRKVANHGACKIPLMEYEPRCEAKVPRYFYNTTSRRCEQFRWNGCLKEDVYEKRIDCAMKCNQSETLDICGMPPHPGLCVGQNYNREMKRFFYNSTSRVCQEYSMCENAGAEMEKNSFSTKTLCIFHCSGFPIRNQNNTTKGGKNSPRRQ